MLLNFHTWSNINFIVLIFCAVSPLRQEATEIKRQRSCQILVILSAEVLTCDVSDTDKVTG